MRAMKLNLSLFSHSKKAASMFSNPAGLQGREQFSLGSTCSAAGRAIVREKQESKAKPEREGSEATMLRSS